AGVPLHVLAVRLEAAEGAQRRADRVRIDATQVTEHLVQRLPQAVNVQPVEAGLCPFVARVVPAAQPLDELQHLPVRPHPGRPAAETVEHRTGAAVGLRPRLDVAGDSIAVGPVALDGDEGEPLLRDQPPAQPFTPAVILVRAVRCLADQHEARVADLLDQRVHIRRQWPRDLRDLLEERAVRRRGRTPRFAAYRCHRSRSSLPGRGAARCRSNQSAASRTTSASAPGSSNRCVAPGTIRRSAPAGNAACAWRFSSMTTGSLPPTISSTGARTRSSAAPARSGRPPRETTAATASGRSAAASRAAAAPVLAPNSPSGRACVSGSARSQSTAPVMRRPSRAISKRSSAVRSSISASCGVSRSKSSVPKPAAFSAAATWRLRGLRRLLPLPWAKATTPHAPSVSARSPSRRASPAETSTLCAAYVLRFISTPPCGSLAGGISWNKATPATAPDTAGRGGRRQPLIQATAAGRNGPGWLIHVVAEAAGLMRTRGAGAAAAGGAAFAAEGV